MIGQLYYRCFHPVDVDVRPLLLDRAVRVLFTVIARSLVAVGWRLRAGIDRRRFRFLFIHRWHAPVGQHAAVHIVLDLLRLDAIILRLAPALGLNIGELLRIERWHDRYQTGQRQ